MRLMNPLTLSLLFALATASFAEEDLRCKVADANDDKSFNSVIDPDNSIFGIPLGTTEEEFITKNGKPLGYLRLKGDETVMIYGKSNGFIFSGGKLAGVILTSHIIDYELAESMEKSKVFPDQDQWQLSNGIKPDMTLARVREIVGDKLSSDEHSRRYHQYFLTEKSRVKLSFSRNMGKGENDDSAYRLRSVVINPRSEKGD